MGTESVSLLGGKGGGEGKDADTEEDEAEVYLPWFKVAVYLAIGDTTDEGEAALLLLLLLLL